MAKIVNVTRGVWYGNKRELEDDGIIVIGSNDNSDFILKFAGGGVSRQHAFIIGKQGEFYIGDLSANGTYCPYYGFDKNTRLVNVLESKTFREGYGDFNFEREMYKDIDSYVDEEVMKRHIFLNHFIKKPENVERLISEGGRVLYRLRQGFKIGIFPLFILEFREGLFRRIFDFR